MDGSLDSFDQSDYLMFLITLFNGYSSFDILNSSSDNKQKEYLIMDENKFQNQQKLLPVILKKKNLTS